MLDALDASGYSKKNLNKFDYAGELLRFVMPGIQSKQFPILEEVFGPNRTYQKITQTIPGKDVTQMILPTQSMINQRQSELNADVQKILNKEVNDNMPLLNKAIEQYNQATQSSDQSTGDYE